VREGDFRGVDESREIVRGREGKGREGKGTEGLLAIPMCHFIDAVLENEM
jgi:hypothetical protein